MKNFTLVLLALGLVMIFGVAVQAKVTGLPHVYNLTFNDQGNPGKDSSENGNNGELKGGAKWVANGYSGGGVQLDGNDGHVEVVVDVPEKNFTMGVWIKTDSGDVGIYSVLDGVAGAGGHDRHFFLKGGKINFRTWQGPAWATDRNVADGKWHHIALVAKDGAGQTAYVDGEKVGTHAYDHSDFDWQKRVWIGFSNDAAKDYFNGVIDGASYTAAALTGDQVKMKLMVPVEPKGKLASTWSDIKTSH